MSDVQQSFSVRQTGAECHRNDPTVLRGTVCDAGCRTSCCRA